MSTKKIAAIIAVIAVVVIAIVAFVMSRGQTQTPPPNTSQNNPPPAVANQETNPWRPYEASIGKYIVSLPSAWFIDPDTAQGGGAPLYISNNDGFESEKDGVVVVEFIPNRTKGASEKLFDAIKKNGKSGGDFGKTESGFTRDGYQTFRVEHAYGQPTDGPGYAIARSKTEYLYIVASSNAEEGTVRQMVASIVFVK